ncbi:MAG: uracil-DNA glycosylase [Alphaproteobacteria bacterium]|nr:uracil-DNA glycosylase [Alphaproteobacteria bacterium]
MEAASGGPPAFPGPAFVGPARDCLLCARLVEFRQRQRIACPDWHNAPVPSFGGLDAKLLIVGLAPGLKGANRTGRPFTGDYAGDLLYATLRKFGLAEGTYTQRPDDGLSLQGARITNAVRCVPPENKPTPGEERNCRPFLVNEMAAMPNLGVVMALGAIAHNSVLAALGQKRSAFPFRHGAEHELVSAGSGRPLVLADSYHCSRYNTNTGKLTTEMFESVVARIVQRLGF